MKIIKEGQIPEYFCTCSYCKCEFTVQKRECYAYYNGGCYVCCPQCNETIIVDLEQAVVHDSPESAWSRFVQLWKDLWRLT